MHAEDFATDVTSQYQLGEGSRFTKQPELAKQQYRNVLAIDPNHALSRARLGALGG